MPRPPDARAPGFDVGVSEPMIEALVAEFYGRVRRDPVLGPIFDAAVADWDQHLARMRDFWSSVTLMTGRYKGKPVSVHAALPDIGRMHFSHWLALFRETAQDVCPPQAAALFIDRAGRIADTLMLGLALHRGGPGIPSSDVNSCTPAERASLHAGDADVECGHTKR